MTCVPFALFVVDKGQFLCPKSFPPIFIHSFLSFPIKSVYKSKSEDRNSTVYLNLDCTADVLHGGDAGDGEGDAAPHHVGHGREVEIVGVVV